MDEQAMLGDQVRQWESALLWIDRGRWKRARNGTLEYLRHTEVVAECRTRGKEVVYAIGLSNAETSGS